MRRHNRVLWSFWSRQFLSIWFCPTSIITISIFTRIHSAFSLDFVQCAAMVIQQQFYKFVHLQCPCRPLNYASMDVRRKDWHARVHANFIRWRYGRSDRLNGVRKRENRRQWRCRRGTMLSLTASVQSINKNHIYIHCYRRAITAIVTDWASECAFIFIVLRSYIFVLFWSACDIYKNKMNIECDSSACFILCRCFCSCSLWYDCNGDAMRSAWNGMQMHLPEDQKRKTKMKKDRSSWEPVQCVREFTSDVQQHEHRAIFMA